MLAAEPSRARPVLVLLTPERAAQLDAIVRAWRPFLLRLASRWAAGRIEVAEDVVQDALVRLTTQRGLPTTHADQRRLVVLLLRRAWIAVQRVETAGMRDSRLTAHLTVVPKDGVDTYDQDAAPFGLELPALRTVVDELLLRECLAELGDGIADLSDEERAALERQVQHDAGLPSRTVREARRKLADRLDAAGYERHDSGLPPYPRNRARFVIERRRKREEEKG